MVIAYGLMRFSGVRQEQGDSMKRQTDWHREAARLHGYDLRPLEVKGVSAFKGRHLRVGDLARFVEQVKAGEIPEGSVLLIERIDRLTRENIDEATELWRTILRRGVNIRTRSPDRLFTRESLQEIIGIIEPLLEMQRAHQESVAKSERVRAAMASQRAEALRSGKQVSTRRLWWLEWKGGRWVVLEDRAEMVREMFRRVIAGEGLRGVARWLNGLGVPTPRGGRGWQPASVQQILAARTTLGEWVSKKMAEPVRGYYPAIVTAETWYRAQAALKHRGRVGGRPGEGVTNLLTGLTYDRATGGRLILQCSRKYKGDCREYLVPERVAQGGRVGDAPSCRYGPVEECVLAMLAELEVSAPAPGPSDDEAEEAFAEVKRRIAEAQARAADPATREPQMYLDLLEQLYGQRRAAQERVSAQRARNARLAGRSSLVMEYLTGREGMAQDEITSARRTLKARLAEVVERVWVAVKKVTHIAREVTVCVEMADGRRKEATVAVGRRAARSTAEGPAGPPAAAPAPTSQARPRTAPSRR